MSKFTNSKIVKQNYTLIYYSALEKMNYQYRDFVVLDTLIRKGKKNEFEKSKAFIYKYLHLAPNTVHESINVLHKLNFISEISNKSISLNHELIEQFKEETESGGGYVKVYHKHRKELGLSIREYSLLYAFYSLSKKFGFTTAKVKSYEKWLGIKEREFHRIKNKFLQKGLILPHSKNNVKLSNEIKDWFDEQLQND